MENRYNGWVSRGGKLLVAVMILALVWRIIMAVSWQHEDVTQYYWWSKDLWQRGFSGFYDREIINAVRPTYPPITSYLFWLVGGLHELVWRICWFLNVHLRAFPSLIIPWLESARGWFLFVKLPAIFCDLGIIFILCKMRRLVAGGREIGILPAIFFAFLPPFWYNSSLWGQTDSVYGLLVLLAFYWLFGRRYVFSGVAYLLALLTKPTAFFALPIFMMFWIRKAGMRMVLGTASLLLILTIGIYAPFHPEKLIGWILAFYSHSLGGELGYINSNAFNLWGLVFGLGQTPDTYPIMGIPVNLLGIFLYEIFLIIVMWMTRIYSAKNDSPKVVLKLASWCAFGAFMFLPRMHERYFYLVLLLLVPLVGIEKDVRKLVLGLAFLHWINLYRNWWVPRIGILVNLISNQSVERVLVVLNIGAFLWLTRSVLRYL